MLGLAAGIRPKSGIFQDKEVYREDQTKVMSEVIYRRDNESEIFASADSRALHLSFHRMYYFYFSCCSFDLHTQALNVKGLIHSLSITRASLGLSMGTICPAPVILIICATPSPVSRCLQLTMILTVKLPEVFQIPASFPSRPHVENPAALYSFFPDHLSASIHFSLPIWLPRYIDQSINTFRVGDHRTHRCNRMSPHS